MFSINSLILYKHLTIPKILGNEETKTKHQKEKSSSI